MQSLVAGSRVAPGQIVTLQATFEVDGALTDLVSVSVDVYDELGTIVISGLTPHRTSTGRYEVDYRAPITAEPGTWRVHWKGETETYELWGEDFVQIVETEDSYPLLDAWNISLRIVLKDTDPRNYAFTTVEVREFLDLALSDVNVWPTFTDYTWVTVPTRWKRMVVLGGQVMSLFAQGLIEAGREFTVTDQGISFTPPQIATHMQTTATSLLQHYSELKEKVKSSIRPSWHALGTYRVLAIHPYLLRLRHLRERRIV